MGHEMLNFCLKQAVTFVAQYARYLNKTKIRFCGEQNSFFLGKNARSKLLAQTVSDNSVHNIMYLGT